MSQLKPTKIYRDSFAGIDCKKENGKSLAWLRDFREGAYERFQTLGFPNRKMENWKYISLEPLLTSVFQSQETPSEISPNALASFFLGTEDKARLVLINNSYQKKFSNLQNLPAKVILEDLASSLEKYPEKLKNILTQTWSEETNPFTAINAFSFQQGAYLNIPEDTVVDGTIHILFCGAGNAAGAVVSYPRLLAVIGAHSKVNIVIQYIGLSDCQYFMDSVNEIRVGEGAQVKLTVVERSQAKAIQFLATRLP